MNSLTALAMMNARSGGFALETSTTVEVLENEWQARCYDGSERLPTLDNVRSVRLPCSRSSSRTFAPALRSEAKARQAEQDFGRSVTPDRLIRSVEEPRGEGAAAGGSAARWRRPHEPSERFLFDGTGPARTPRPQAGRFRLYP